MDMNSFIESLAENVFTDTERQLLSKETEYMELEEWTSMVAFTLISYIERTYGKKLTLPELLQAQTLEGLYIIVNN